MGGGSHLSWSRGRGHGAGIKRAEQVEGAGRTGTWGGESGEGGAGGPAPWEGCMEGEDVWVVAAMWGHGAMGSVHGVCGWWQPCGILGP